MILIFGGTTEGRLAAGVCEEAGKPYYYSTKSDLQEIKMHHGVRLIGGMTADSMIAFCREHDIRCIIDAAHPFAEVLHQNIADCQLPVIRLERQYPPHEDGVVYCKDYADAIEKLNQHGIERLLALTGVNTISRLKPYWQYHAAIFRILNRPESMAIVSNNHFSEENIIFYNDDHELPTVDMEKTLMEQLHCNAIITKESGSNGGFEAKKTAALSLGMKVFVVQRPTLPAHWTYAFGQHGLRRAVEKIIPDFFPLHTGLTTGACATAAVKGALLSLLNGDYAEEVSFQLPDGEPLTIPVEHHGRGVASVVKDHSDDPDVTRGCRIMVKVEIADESSGTGPVVRFLRGKGVGVVTLPGLGVPVGEPAINPTPRKMMTDTIRMLTNCSVDVTISVENGEEIATRTFNERVGVVNGISIIGTSGIVKPLSNEAFISSIRRQLDVAWAIGRREVGLVAGMKSETLLRKEKDILCVHYGNFVGAALQAAYDVGFRHVTIAIMIGKAVKLAEGHLDTHSHKVEMNKNFLRDIAIQEGLDPSPIDEITMARQLWNVMPSVFFDSIARLCLRHCQTVFRDGNVDLRLMREV